MWISGISVSLLRVYQHSTHYYFYYKEADSIALSSPKPEMNCLSVNPFASWLLPDSCKKIYTVQFLDEYFPGYYKIAFRRFENPKVDCESEEKANIGTKNISNILRILVTHLFCWYLFFFSNGLLFPFKIRVNCIFKSNCNGMMPLSFPAFRKLPKLSTGKKPLSPRRQSNSSFSKAAKQFILTEKTFSKKVDPNSLGNCCK